MEDYRMLTLFAALGVLALLLALQVVSDLRRARYRLGRARELAEIFQVVAREERERGDAWMQRALHPDANRTLWDAIDDWLEQERQR